MAKEKLNWTNMVINEATATDAVKEALIDMEAAREMQNKAKDVLAEFVASKINVPQGHEVKIGTGFGKLSYAIARKETRKTACF